MTDPPIRHTLPYWLEGCFHSLAYVAWGDPDAPPVLCVHGLTRTGRDFDALAASLADRFHVVCPDLPGRGLSDWLPEPRLYQPPFYVAALAHLLARLGRPVQWVGTSLGGICGMLAAAAPGAPITRLVLNDVGPFIPEAAIARIRDYIGTQPVFADAYEAAAYLRRVHAPFGPLSEAQWLHLASTGTRAAPGGGLTLHYDPAIAIPMRAAEPAAIDMWPLWDRIDIPTLALRGETSDLLLPETFARMAARAETCLVPDCGHAPALMDAMTIGRIRDFLLRSE